MTTSQPVGQFVYQVYVSGVLYTDSPPLDVKLCQEWGKHDIFTLRIDYPLLHNNPNQIQLWAHNSPVKIIWGRSPDNLHTWYGYVNHYENANPSDSGFNGVQTTYYLIGTSKPMNQDVNKAWGSVTPTYIAKTIADKYALRAVLTSTDWLLPNETQAAESDFNFLNRIAGKTGFRFWVSGGTLYFIDPAVILLSSKSINAVPVFRQDKALWQHDTMRKFREVNGDNLPGVSITSRQAYGLTDYGQVINAVADGATGIPNIKTDRHITTYNQGKRIANAWQSFGQFWRQACAELYGNVLVYPGKLVSVQGNWLPGNAAGYWIICKADHKLKSAYTPDTSHDWYVTEAIMVRNTSNTLPNLKATNTILPEFVTCNLINGSWQATNRAVIYDGNA